MNVSVSFVGSGAGVRLRPIVGAGSGVGGLAGGG